jgi:DNA-binding XRE family transcriptional regulator
MRTRKFSELRQQLLSDPVRAGQVADARRELEDEFTVFQKTLAELRRARTLTQEEVARVLGVSPAQVYRIENQVELYLSTLDAYIRAMGGELRLSAAFGDKFVPLAIGDLAGEVGSESTSANQPTVSEPALAN